MVIFDWDDTIQKNLKPKGSLDIFLKTILYPCNKEWVKNIFKDKHKKIITTRSKLYTFAIRLKCFLITFNFKAFSDEKVSTINPYFLFNEKCLKKFHENNQEHLLIVENMKINLSKIQDLYIHDKKHENYTYVDLDKDNEYQSKKER